MTTMAAERTLPHNLEAERSVLGVVLVSHGKALDVIGDRLKPADFYRSAHQQIFQSMLDLYARGDAVDFITLKEALARKGHLDEVGGPGYISQVCDGVPSATNVAYYARIVREKGIARNVIYAANRLLTSAYEQEGEVGELLDAAERELLDLSTDAVPGDLVGAAEMVRNIYPVIESLVTSRRPVTGVSTGFGELDRYTRGMQPGNLLILAARPGHGKSTIATQLALHVSRDLPIAFFSLEVSQQEQMFRVISTLGKVDGHALQCGQVSMFDQQEIQRALEDFKERRFWFDDSPTMTALQIRSRARRLRSRIGQLGLIVVDYIGLLRHPQADRHDLRVGESVKMLLATARELSVPVVALCQLSRGSDQRQDDRPRLSDLRDSGEIEQHANVVLFLHRPRPKPGDAAVPPTELIIAKQRNGPTAQIELAWIGEQYRFAEIEQHR